MTDALSRIHTAFAEASVTGRLHALDIDSGAQIDVGADQPVCTASVHKLCLLIALHELAAAGHLDLREQIECAPDRPHLRPHGPCRHARPRPHVPA